jgi:peroxiredoxin
VQRPIQAAKILALFFFLFFFPCRGAAFSSEDLGRAPEIRGKVWYNAGFYKSINWSALRGKVVLLFFWTMDDAHCAQAAASLNDWYTQDRSKAFEIIGIHSAEWDFAFSQSALFKKIESLKIKFPVIADADPSVRMAYDVAGWPAFCLVDRKGIIRARYYGLFSYAEVKAALDVLLEEGA